MTDHNSLLRSKPIRIQASHTVVCNRPPDSDYNYFAWGSVARDPQSDTLYVTCSGFRRYHVDPWGQTVFTQSDDGGMTWSEPRAVHNSPIDDRDSGVLALGDNTLLISWFSLDIRRLSGLKIPEKHRTEAEQTMRDWDSVEAQASIGSWTQISRDGGKSWGEPRHSPVTAPHGPIRTAGGGLLYVGKGFRQTALPTSQAISAYLSADLGASWTCGGDIPFPADMRLDNLHEPHVVERAPGSYLAHIRVHRHSPDNPSGLAIYQSESTDGGFTWSIARPIGILGSPPHLMRHSSGTLICSYGHRNLPFGQQIILSRDGGATWSDPMILRDDGPDTDLGYPATVEMLDGSLFTMYYQKIGGEPQTSILGSLWRLPDV